MLKNSLFVVFLSLLVASTPYMPVHAAGSNSPQKYTVKVSPSIVWPFHHSQSFTVTVLDGLKPVTNTTVDLKIGNRLKLSQSFNPIYSPPLGETIFEGHATTDNEGKVVMDASIDFTFRRVDVYLPDLADNNGLTLGPNYGTTYQYYGVFYSNDKSMIGASLGVVMFVIGTLAFYWYWRKHRR